MESYFLNNMTEINKYLGYSSFDSLQVLRKNEIILTQEEKAILIGRLQASWHIGRLLQYHPKYLTIDDVDKILEKTIKPDDAKVILTESKFDFQSYQIDKLISYLTKSQEAKAVLRRCKVQLTSEQIDRVILNITKLEDKQAVLQKCKFKLTKKQIKKLKSHNHLKDLVIRVLKRLIVILS